MTGEIPSRSIETAQEKKKTTRLKGKRTSERESGPSAHAGGKEEKRKQNARPDYAREYKRNGEQNETVFP